MGKDKENILEKLKTNIGKGETINIVYYGGSQPGSTRPIVPVKISGDKLTAVCLNSKKSKQFILSKIEIADKVYEHSTLDYNPSVTTRPKKYETLSQLLDDKQKFLKTLGWHIECGSKTFQITPSHEQQHEYLYLFSRFKNGKLRKTCDIELTFELLRWDTIYESSDQGEPVNIKKRSRPWIVRGKNQDTKTYGNLDKAVGLFLDWAELLKP